MTYLKAGVIGSVALVACILLYAIAAHAQAATVVGANCAIKWNANTEADLAGYRVYATLTSSPTASITTTVDVLKPVVSTTCAALHMQSGGVLSVQVDAVDQLGNRSAKSVAVTVTQDVSAPAQPTGITITANP